MDSHSQIYLPRLSKVNQCLIIISAVLFLIDKFTQLNLTNYLGLSAEHFLSGHIYSIATYPFLSRDLLEVILNCLMLWLMGSEFEANWGTKRYINFLLSVVVGGGALFVAIATLFFRSSPTGVYGYHLVGLSGIVSSLCVAYAVIFPDRVFSFMMLIPVKAKYFCMILVAISLFQGLGGPTGVGAWGQLGGIVAAYLFMILVSNRNFKLLSQKMGKMTQMRSAKKSKAKLSIVKDDNDQPPKYWQ